MPTNVKLRRVRSSGIEGHGVREAAATAPEGTRSRPACDMPARGERSGGPFWCVPSEMEGGERFASAASRCKRGDGLKQPSRTALERAVSASGPIVCLDVDEHARLSGDLSVRALCLRSILAAPLPSPTAAGRAALVVDSRGTPNRPIPELLPMVEACAFIAAMALALAEQRNRSSGCTAGPAPTSPVFRQVLAWAERIAPSKLPVLIQGESGSGKEEIARLLHRLGPRPDGPFVAVNCTAFSESLLDAELFDLPRRLRRGAGRVRPVEHWSSRGLRLAWGTAGRWGGRSFSPFDGAITGTASRHEASRGSFRRDLYTGFAIEVKLPPLREGWPTCRRWERLGRLVEERDS